MHYKRTCPTCKYRWRPRKVDPKRCPNPNCGAILPSAMYPPGRKATVKKER